MRRRPRGRLELTWMGKDSTLIAVEDGKYDYAWVDPADPRVREIKGIQLIDAVGETDGPTGSDENLLLVGDAGDALRSLGTIPEYAQKYRGQVKLVYIDPPFNTGETFEHYADQLENSVWLTMMRDRIRGIRPLMASDATIWVHLDDVQMHRMRLLLDEEFGAENFVATVVWQKAYSPKNDAPGFSTDQDYILVYSLTPDWRSNRWDRLASRDALYKATDGDDRPWISADPAAPSAHRNQTWVYAIQSPFTGDLVYPAKSRCWGQNQDSMQSILEEWGVSYKRVVLDDDERRAKICGVTESEVRKGIPALMVERPLHESEPIVRRRYEQGTWPALYFTKNGNGGIKRKRYLDETSTSRAPRTLWFNDEVGHNRTAKNEINLLFPDQNAFSTPKPERLLQRIIQISTNPGDLVLDAFAGSGTTAAVAHKMGRHWVTCELQESTVDAFIRPRLTMVVQGADPGGVTSTTTRVAEGGLPDGVSPEDARKFVSLLTKFAKAKEVDVPAASLRQLRAAAKTRDETTSNWAGGGGFTVARIGPSMYDVDDENGMVFLSPQATNGTWSKAVAGQLRFTLTPEHPVFAGVRGRQRLAVIDGVVDELAVRTVVESLSEKERAVIVAKGVLPEAESTLAELSPGSRIKKAPEQMFPKETVK